MKQSTAKKVKGALRIALLVIAAAVVGVNLYAMNASRLAGNALPMPFGVGVAVVLSGSMEPELSVGDLVIVTESEDYAEQDVIVFQQGSMAVTHRIVSISEEEVITKGDANNAEDEPITLSQIKGRVAFVIPLVGHLVNLIKTPIGTLVIIALAVFLLERSFNADKEKDKKQLDDIRAEIEKLKQQQNQ